MSRPNFASCAALAALLLVTSRAQAQTQVPSLDGRPAAGPAPAAGAGPLPPGTPTGRPPPPLTPLTGRERPLKPREKAALQQSQSWIDRLVLPAPGPDGLTYYVFGATRPTLVCAPLTLCRIRLQEGELVSGVLIGDPLGWVVEPGASGEVAARDIQVILKPSEVGLATNIIITTNRRTYDIALVSRKTDAMVGLAFTYPSDQQARWTAFNDNLQREQLQAKAQAEALAAAQRQAVQARAEAEARRPPVLQFEYEITGDKPRWRPVRVYHDGHKTYIEFPPGLRDTEAPAFVLLSDSSEPQIANYRKVGDVYVIDQVVDRCALLTGVGRHQVRVDIRRVGRR